MSKRSTSSKKAVSTNDHSGAWESLVRRNVETMARIILYAGSVDTAHPSESLSMHANRRAVNYIDESLENLLPNENELSRHPQVR